VQWKLGEKRGKFEARVAEGMGAIMHRLAEGLDVHLNSVVNRVNWRMTGKWKVQVEVAGRDAPYRAHAVIITLPVGLLIHDDVSFDPPLPEAKQRALAAMRMEPATKYIYVFSDRMWEENMTYLCCPGLFPRWWVSSFGRKGTRTHIIACFVTGRRAAETDRWPEHEALRSGLVALSQLLGKPLQDLEAKLLGCNRICWAHEQFTRGGYANVQVGAHDARQGLAEPVQGVLFFAGEATADRSVQTIHGALQAGQRAAGELLDALSQLHHSHSNL